MHCTRALFWNNGFVAATQEAADSAANQAANEAHAQAVRKQRENEKFEKSGDAALMGIFVIAVGVIWMYIGWNSPGAFSFLAWVVFYIPGLLACIVGFRGLLKPTAAASEGIAKGFAESQKIKREQGNQAPPPGQW